jgi:hypothetical protein
MIGLNQDYVPRTFAMIKLSSRFNRLFGFGLAFLTIVGGCGKANNQTAVVQGTVTIEGELAKQGIVTFHPKGGGPVAYGPIRPDGTFTMQVGQGKTTNLDASQIQIGDYIVTVVVAAPAVPKTGDVPGPPEPGPRLTAKKYSNKETTDLKYTVKLERNIYNIDIERATQEELDAEKAEKASPEENKSEAMEEPATETEQSSEEQGGTAEGTEDKKVDAEAAQP